MSKQFFNKKKWKFPIYTFLIPASFVIASLLISFISIVPDQTSQHPIPQVLATSVSQPVCSSNTNQKCGYTNDCTYYTNGTLCEREASCNGKQSNNTVYICSGGSWVYDYSTSLGSCNFCGGSPPDPCASLKLNSNCGLNNSNSGVFCGGNASPSNCNLGGNRATLYTCQCGNSLGQNCHMVTSKNCAQIPNGVCNVALGKNNTDSCTTAYFPPIPPPTATPIPTSIPTPILTNTIFPTTTNFFSPTPVISDIPSLTFPFESITPYITNVPSDISPTSFVFPTQSPTITLDNNLSPTPTIQPFISQTIISNISPSATTTLFQSTLPPTNTPKNSNNLLYNEASYIPVSFDFNFAKLTSSGNLLHPFSLTSIILSLNNSIKNMFDNLISHDFGKLF